MRGVVFLMVATTLQAEGFYPIEERNGVQVFRKDTSHGIELGAEGDLPAPPDQVMRVLLDYDNHPKWVRGLKESRVLGRGDNWVDVYQKLNLPIISDRDFTLHVTHGEKGATRWLRFATANDKGPPPHKGVIRVDVHEGGWQLEPIDNGRSTHAVYQFHLDLAGSIPSWMGRGRAGRDMPTLFESIRKQLQP
jgi:hypothetical protein